MTIFSWKDKAYALSWHIEASLGDTKWAEQNNCLILVEKFWLHKIILKQISVVCDVIDPI